MSGCSEHQTPREYQEVSKRPSVASHLDGVPEDTHHGMFFPPQKEVPEPMLEIKKDSLKSHIEAVWTEMAPAWVEAPLAAMSIATFKPSSATTGAQVTFTVLAGKGGGLQENVTRWLRQLKLLTPTDEQLEAFLAKLETKKSSTGISFTFVDFTSLGTQGNEPSMLAAVVDLGNQTLFIKLSGSLSELKLLRREFLNKLNATVELKGQSEN